MDDLEDNGNTTHGGEEPENENSHIILFLCGTIGIGGKTFSVNPLDTDVV